ncbi:hypothetical protein KIH77_05300 [Bifidobacterium sp. 82T24]|uniref:hypothetical protein n=1 Tax=Bifidobacterium pluvialisilvae TaxID=2834436 RepID=UPI001C59D37D|nr:hypothetical protein [Bifidobacterium pluvialisilvae]MBW3088145.1 hypothetical protein [Bifidobacterium pluvialisilvae]
MADINEESPYPYRTDDWNLFKELCEANIEMYFDYKGREYFVTSFQGGDDFTWFVCDFLPFKKDLSLVPVSDKYDSLEKLADEKIFDGRTKSIRDCYREFDLWQS